MIPARLSTWSFIRACRGETTIVRSRGGNSEPAPGADSRAISAARGKDRQQWPIMHSGGDDGLLQAVPSS